MDQTRLAQAAGLAPETISRAKKRGTIDLVTIDALAHAAGLQLGLAPLAKPGKPRKATAQRAPAVRSPLADPKWGLVWSNAALDDGTLIRNALARGGFIMLLQAVKAHGISEVLAQWNTVRPELKPRARAEVERQLRNIQEGISSAQA